MGCRETERYNDSCMLTTEASPHLQPFVVWTSVVKQYLADVHVSSLITRIRVFLIAESIRKFSDRCTPEMLAVVLDAATGLGVELPDDIVVDFVTKTMETLDFVDDTMKMLRLVLIEQVIGSE